MYYLMTERLVLSNSVFLVTIIDRGQREITRDAPHGYEIYPRHYFLLVYTKAVYY